MYQPHNVKPISTENNKYLIYYEATSWSLDEGPGEWRRIDEPLEVQSDDIDGRTKLYNSLVRGKNTPESSIPESFNVLVKELEGLGLNVMLN